MNKRLLLALSLLTGIQGYSFGAINIDQLKDYLPAVVKNIQNLEPALNNLVNGNIAYVRNQVDQIDLQKTLTTVESYIAAIKSSFPEILQIIKSSPVANFAQPAIEYLENNQNFLDSINTKFALLEKQATRANIMRGLDIIEQNFARIQNKAQLNALFVTKVQTPLNQIKINEFAKAITTISDGIRTKKISLALLVAVRRTLDNLSKLITAIGGVSSVVLAVSDGINVPLPAEISTVMMTIKNSSDEIAGSMENILPSLINAITGKK